LDRIATFTRRTDPLYNSGETFFHLGHFQKTMKSLFASLILITLVAGQGGTSPAPARQETASDSASQPANLPGRWRVKFTLGGIGEKNLFFDLQAKGFGTFQLLDAGPANKSVAAPLPAVWSETTNNRISFSGEVEFQLGTCCREMGTLMFKGKFDSTNSISGKAIFVGCTIDEENFNGFRSTVGSFTATREVK
jgi:hypothetical protein